jgi:hypothetical protein
MSGFDLLQIQQMLKHQHAAGGEFVPLNVLAMARSLLGQRLTAAVTDPRVSLQRLQLVRVS